MPGASSFTTVNSINGLSFYNKGAPYPFSPEFYVQSVFDSYLREEVGALHLGYGCQSRVAIATMGASFGRVSRGEYSVQASGPFFKPLLLRHVWSLRPAEFHGWLFYDDNFYFNNPVDYLANLSNSWYYEQLASCDIHPHHRDGAVGNTAGPRTRLSEVL